jgi:putative ABC transport system permease protein
MKYLRLVLRSFLRSKRRTVLTILSITVSVALIAILQSILATLNAFANNPDASNRIVVRHKVSITNLLPTRYADWLRQQPEVESVMGLQWFQGVYIDRSNFFPNFASEAEFVNTVFKEEIVEYSDAQFREFLRDRNGALVGKNLADKYGWKLGDVVSLKSELFPITVRLTIRCIFRSKRPADELALHFNYKLLEEGVSYMKGRVGTFFVRVHRADDVPKLIERIDRHFHDAVEPTYSETENAFQLEFLKMMGNYSAIIQMITGAVLVAILIVTANTMAMAIRERTTEISVLRAIGFRTSQILAMLMGEGILLSVLGGAGGLAIAWLLAGAVRGYVGTFLPYLQNFHIDAGTMSLCFHATLAVGTLSTFIPAYRAARRPIVDGLRSL